MQQENLIADSNFTSISEVSSDEGGIRNLSGGSLFGIEQDEVITNNKCGRCLKCVLGYLGNSNISLRY